MMTTIFFIWRRNYILARLELSIGNW